MAPVAAAVITALPSLVRLAEGLFRRRKDQPKNGPEKSQWVTDAAYAAAVVAALAEFRTPPTREDVQAEVRRTVDALNGSGDLDAIANGADPVPAPAPPELKEAIRIFVKYGLS